MSRITVALFGCLLVFSVSAFAEPVKPGLWKKFVYDTPDTTPIVYGGESRSENVHATDYCVYLDIFYADGSTTWGERAEFEQGTHGWQKVCGAMAPKKPVKRIEVYALCRNGLAGGHAEFRDLFLERREGRGDRLYETRRSNRPFADTDEIFYSDFTGRDKTRRHETTSADKSVWTPSPVKQGAAIWAAGSMRRIAPTDFPSASDLAAAPRIDLDIAKRGAGSAQILVTTADDAEWQGATLRMPVLRDAQGRAIKGSVEWQRVGYIPSGSTFIPHPNGQAPRAGWRPDPLLPPAPFRVRKGATQALWITVHAAADAAPGTYSGEIEVVEGGATRGRVAVSVRVRDFALPATFGLDTAWGLMDGFLRAAYPHDWKRIRRQAQDVMLDYRQNPDDISRTELPEIDDLIHARERGMSGFTVLNLVPPPKNPNSKWVCYVQPSEVFNDAFYSALKARLKPYMAELRARGLDKFARLYGFDERGSEYYPGLHKLCDRLKADFPTLPLLTTALLYNDIESRWPKFLSGEAQIDDLLVTDMYCPLTTRWHTDISDYLRTQGKRVYWYTAGSPIWPYANFAGYAHPPVEGRLVIGFQTHFFRADGFLFWHVNYWNGKEQEPFDDADTFLPGWLYTAGDGILLYPGKDRVFPSIRLATVRDGVQDYEWLQLAERKCGRTAVDAVSRTIIRSLRDFERDPAAVEKAHATIGDMIEAAEARRIADVPERHAPVQVMGKDYWPALYKYGDWVSPVAERKTRFDNPEINNLPAFRDATPVYHGRREPPSAGTGLAVWRSFRDNFRNDERDHEILDSNPAPDKPLILWTTGKRKAITLGGKINLDYAEYAAWKAAHPNAMFDGIVVEWDNDLMMSYDRADKIDDPVRRAQVKTFLGNCPTNRMDRMAMMRRHLANRRYASYSADMGAFVAHIYNLHLAGDCGAKYLCIETTNTSGGLTDDSEYRWNTAAMFARGAARQFGVPWEWYVAGYMNGVRENGEWLNNSICTHPSTAEGLAPSDNKGPEFGVSANLLRRVFYFAYLSGANFTQMEEWSAQFQTWDAKAGKTVLTPLGREYVRFHDFTQSNPGRGVPYTPVAICVPISQGYCAFGGWPWCSPSYGYTRGDHEIDAAFFTIVPGFERAKAMKAGVETNLHNSRYAHMYDVLCPDAPSQSPSEILEAMKSYKALVVVGDYADRDLLESRLAAYKAAGGRVIRFDEKAVPEPVKKFNAVADVKSGRAKFPAVEKAFDALQAELFPFKVSGDCLYGANRTKDGWWLWVFNNRGVTKFADKMARIDHGCDVEISVKSANARIAAAKELLSGKPVAVAGGAFRHRIPAGDLAVFEIK